VGDQAHGGLAQDGDLAALGHGAGVVEHQGHLKVLQPAGGGGLGLDRQGAHPEQAAECQGHTRAQVQQHLAVVVVAQRHGPGLELGVQGAARHAQIGFERAVGGGLGGVQPTPFWPLDT